MLTEISPCQVPHQLCQLALRTSLTAFEEQSSYTKWKKMVSKANGLALTLGLVLSTPKCSGSPWETPKLHRQRCASVAGSPFHASWRASSYASCKVRMAQSGVKDLQRRLLHLILLAFEPEMSLLYLRSTKELQKLHILLS